VTLLTDRCRSLARKISAVAILPDPDRIICGDKFGDVYSFPLIPNPEEDAAAAAALKQKSAKPIGPAASELTVHSKKNRQILEMQRKALQEQAKAASESDNALAFAHELLLGHVSMLTDLLVAEMPDNQKPRRCIVTADRDEHVRVSRGPPQAYVTEAYCLGHQEFVYKLLLARPEVLVSAGGDDELYFWDWAKGQLMFKINIKDPINKLLQKSATKSDALEAKPTVTGLWLYQGTSTEKVCC
jgi:tRNA (guanine-N(7)-)-methyltransferase subunit TRM82